MTEYWKSIDKKFCDVCKCWLTDNKASVSFHENGNRHKMAVQQRLKDIHKKNKADDKKDKKLDRDMKRIEEAALAAAKKDMVDNPDVSMQIQSYHDGLKKHSQASSSPGELGTKATIILHRSDKQKKADEAFLAEMQKPTKDYNRFSGWDTQKEKIESNFLELPSKKSTSKSPGVSLQFAAKAKPKKMSFGEKTITSLVASSTSSSSHLAVKSEGSEITFKKRKASKGNMRCRGDDNE